MVALYHLDTDFLIGALSQGGPERQRLQELIETDQDLAERAAEQFLRLGIPRRRAADIAIGTMGAARNAILLSRNACDFAGIDALEVEIVR